MRGQIKFKLNENSIEWDTYKKGYFPKDIVYLNLNWDYLGSDDVIKYIIRCIKLQVLILDHNSITSFDATKLINLQVLNTFYL